MTSKRTLSAAVMLVVFFLALLAPWFHWFLPILVFAFGAVCLWELAQWSGSKRCGFRCRCVCCSSWA